MCVCMCVYVGARCVFCVCMRAFVFLFSCAASAGKLRVSGRRPARTRTLVLHSAVLYGTHSTALCRRYSALCTVHSALSTVHRAQSGYSQLAVRGVFFPNVQVCGPDLGRLSAYRQLVNLGSFELRCR